MQYVIVGSSAAGISAVEAIRSKDKKSKITVVSDEKKPLYSRCLISYLLAGTINKDKIWYRPESFFKKNKVEPLLGIKAKKLDMDKKELRMDDGKKLKFDKLLIATGASAKIEDIPGKDKTGVYPLRTLTHTLEILSILDDVRDVSVLGGGLIGLRAAYALKNRGKKVSVFVRSPQILSRIVDSDAARMMQNRLQAKGIDIQTGKSALRITGDSSVQGLVLNDNSEVECQLIIMGKGVNPNSDIAKDAGIKVNRGIVVDKSMRSSHPDVYAAGDVAECFDIASQDAAVNAIWPVACEQGKIAGLNMLGEDWEYDGSLAMNSIEFFGLPLISIGITRPKKDTYKEIIKKDDRNSIYRKIVLKDGVIVGAVFVNAIDNIGVVGALIKNRVDITDIKDEILEDYFEYGRIINLIKNSKHGFKESEFKETVMTFTQG